MVSLFSSSLGLATLFGILVLVQSKLNTLKICKYFTILYLFELSPSKVYYVLIKS